MELNYLCLNVTIFMGSFILLFGILRRANEWYYVNKLGGRRHFLPPGDMGWPLLGNMLSFIRDFKSSEPNTFINNLVKRYGRAGMYKTHLLGSPTIIVCTPETCKQVLTDEEKFATGYPESTMRLFGNFHSFSRSEYKRLRKLATSPFKGHEALAMRIEYIEDTITASLEKWGRMDRPIEFLSEVRKVTFKVTMHIFLGSCSDALLESVDEYFTDLFAGVKSAPINIPGFAYHSALTARKKLVKLIQEIVGDRRSMKKSDEQKTSERGTIDLLMELEDDNGEKLKDENIVDIILAFLLGGHDSSSLIATWATICLHQHPEMLVKAKEEQEEIVKKRSSTQKGLSVTEIKQMKYLPKVIDETLRLITPPITSMRKAITDVNMKGYIIPEGWKVIVSNQGVHMDPENYPTPKEFDPSRWDNHIAKPGSFIPFGGGLRYCPGADLAKFKISVFLHYFLLNYKLERLNPKCPTTYLPYPRPTDNCLAKVIKVK